MSQFDSIFFFFFFLTSMGCHIEIAREGTLKSGLAGGLQGYVGSQSNFWVYSIRWCRRWRFATFEDPEGSVRSTKDEEPLSRWTVSDLCSVS